MKKSFLTILAFVSLYHAYSQNVGIGTATPATKLDVNGTVNASSGYYANTTGAGANSPINKELIINLPNTVASTIEIGNLSLLNGAHNVRVSVSVSNTSFSVSKMYNLSITYNATNNVWYEVIPATNTGPSSGNDFAMDISVSNNTANLRLRRTVGTTDGSTTGGSGARVRIESEGATTDVFTAASATATGVTAPTAQYGYSGSVPVGGIILWSGSTATIPAGWQLCDGTNSTPDLRDRFVIGAGNTYAVAATGGAATHTHSTPALTVPALSIPSLSVPALTIPSLTVSGSTNQGNSNTDRYSAINGCCGSYYSRDIHTHTVSGSTTASSTGIGSTAANSTGTGTIAANTSGSASSLPPYYALAYIMRRF
jgi:hypothetical protein